MPYVNALLPGNGATEELRGTEVLENHRAPVSGM